MLAYMHSIAMHSMHIPKNTTHMVDRQGVKMQSHSKKQHNTFTLTLTVSR